MLLLPDIEGCTIITDSGYCTCMGVPQAVVKQLFYREREIDSTTSLIDPVRKEVHIVMNNRPIADIYCELLKQVCVKAIPIHSENPDKVFKGGIQWKD